jgi:hypothetical protein
VALLLAGMDSVKDIIYIYGDKHNHCYITSGINFREFIQGLPFPIQNILLLKHDVQWADYNLNSSFNYVEKEYISQLVNEDVEKNPDFCWVDFEELLDLDELEPREISELLYLAHKKEPISKPFLPRLNNSFAYINMNGGQYKKVYYKRMNDFLFMLCNSITNKLNTFNKKGINFFSRPKNLTPIHINLMLKLLPLMEDGIIIDLTERSENRKSIEIPIYRVNYYAELDEVIANVDEHREKTNQFAVLIYSKKDNEWSLTEV